MENVSIHVKTFLTTILVIGLIGAWMVIGLKYHDLRESSVSAEEVCSRLGYDSRSFKNDEGDWKWVCFNKADGDKFNKEFENTTTVLDFNGRIIGR